MPPYRTRNLFAYCNSSCIGRIKPSSRKLIIHLENRLLNDLLTMVSFTIRFWV